LYSKTFVPGKKKSLVWEIPTTRYDHSLEGTDFVLNRLVSTAVQNVHNLSLAGYCEQDRLSLYMDGGTGPGGGVLTVTIESEVCLTVK